MRWAKAAALAAVTSACGGDDPQRTDTGLATTGASGSTSSASESSVDDSGSASAGSTSVGTTANEDTTAAESSGGTGGTPGARCGPIPDCEAPLPNPGPAVDWEHTESDFVVGAGGPNHRGRDMFYNEGDEQWVLAKFAYGPNDWDLEDELVAMYLLRDCAGEWEPLGEVRTTYEGDHVAVEGVTDTGGRIYHALSRRLALGPGRHRVHFVVRGDVTRADAYIEVVPQGTPIFVADVDGTLTTYETEEFALLLSGDLPEVQPGAPQVLATLVEKGYHPVYLTARPEWLDERTRAFVHDRGLPPGIIHTTLSFDGALGDAAVTYKTGELAALAQPRQAPHWVFGNTDSDAQAYENAGVVPLEQRIFVQFDDPHGGRRIESYADIAGDVAALPDHCE